MYNFELYHYGPFSAELSAQLDRLVSMGYLIMSPEPTPSGYTRYQYRLSDKGKAFIHEMREKRVLDAELQKTIVSVSEKYGSIPLPKLVKIAYRNL